jgi:COMPASS component SWD3
LTSCSSDSLIKIWNTNTYALVATLTGHGTGNAVFSLAFDPSRPGIMASGSQDRTIKVWDLNVASPSDASSLVTTLAGHAYSIYTVAFETTGLMASGDIDVVIIIWETNRTVKFNINSQSPVYSLAFSPLMVNRLLASGHSNFQIKMWNPSTAICTSGHKLRSQTQVAIM